jgi:hypothetical protein
VGKVGESEARMLTDENSSAAQIHLPERMRRLQVSLVLCLMCVRCVNGVMSVFKFSLSPSC